MTLTVWRRFLTQENPERCEAYLRRHLGYGGATSLIQVCSRHMQATERPACSLEVVAGRIRVGNPPAWTTTLAAEGGGVEGASSPILLKARIRERRAPDPSPNRANLRIS